MTIERQYSLPNCKLVLQGLGNGNSSPLDKRQLLTMLMSAECHFVGHPQPLSGGREFFESLVYQVSQYVQAFLSGVSSSIAVQDQSGLVQLQQINENLHRLTVYNSNDSHGNDPSPQSVKSATQVDLTTVQLFDLVEAVDQFLADGRTLPELSLELKPQSRRTVKPEKPVTQRAVPAAIGVSSLALAAIAFFVVPVPEVRRPKDPVAQPQAQTESVETSTATGSDDPDTEPSVSPSPEETLEPTLTTPPKITDPEEIDRLGSQLYEEIEQSWIVTPTLTRTLNYRVSVAEDGAIIGYNSLNDATAEEEEQIPLPKLLYKPVGSRATDEPLADFEVIFNPDGLLEVSPWTEDNPE